MTNDIVVGVSKNKLPRLILILLLLNPFMALGQSGLKFSGSFSDTPVISILGQMEDQLSLRVFYKKEWVDTINYSGSFSNKELNQVLNTIFEPFEIYHFIQGNSVFLTKDFRVIDDLDFIVSQKRSNIGDYVLDSASTLKSQRPLFKRDYQEVSSVTNRDERRVQEIGSRAKYKADGKSTVAGFIKDRQAKEPIQGALVYTLDGKYSGVSSSDGLYSLSLPNGRNSLLIQYAGMKRARREVVVFSDGTLNIDMEVDVVALNEIVVEATRTENVESLQMGVEKLSVETSRTVPLVLGERDILKVATTFAGVQTVGEASSGFNVRGGKSDQNLFLFDGATVYNTSHFLGFFSIFNSDALSNMEIYKSGIPPKYGGRLSSIFEISSKVANKEKVVVEGGVSIITSRLTVELPIIKEKSSLMLSGRTTYSDWILDRIENADFRDNDVAFSDFIFKYDHDLSPRDNLSLSGYYSRDQFRLNSDTLFSFSDFSYTNKMGSAKWSHQFNNVFDASLLVSSSSYGYEFEFTESLPNAFVQDFDIEELSIKSDFNYDLGAAHVLNFGFEGKRYEINPGSRMPLVEESAVQGQTILTEQAVEGALYFSDQIRLSEKIGLDLGLRYSLYKLIGPRQSYEYQDGVPRNTSSIIDTLNYQSAEEVQSYHGPEFRVSARYLLDSESSIKLSISRNRQYIHALSNSASISPTDIWRLSNEYIEPQVADQIALGYFRNFLNGDIETSIEVYGKRMQNLLDFKTGADFLLNEAIETIGLQGPGKSYGIELSIKKKGRLNGWFNYAYARSFIRLNGEFPEETINNGMYFPTNYDQPHTFNLVSNYEATTRLILSYNFAYSTGRPVTYPTGRYQFRGIDFVNYSDRNSFRIPDYFRMDVGATLKWGHRKDKQSKGFWSFSIYNLLGRDNPFSIFFDIEEGNLQGFKLSVFASAIPTISYNFKF